MIPNNNSVLTYRGVHPPWDHDAFPPCFRKILRFIGKFLKLYLFPKNSWFSSTEISDDFFLVIDQKFWIPPYFACFSTFPPWLAKIIISPYFHKFPPCFRKIHQLFTYFCVFPPTLTMMHLCITQCTYWTPLNLSNHAVLQLCSILVHLCRLMVNKRRPKRD